MSNPKKIFSDTSRYYHLAEGISLDRDLGLLTVDELKDVEFPESPDDVYHTTNPFEILNLENLAHKYYGEPRLWWVIGMTNNIMDPFVEDDTNLTLRIPNYSTIRKTLENL